MTPTPEVTMRVLLKRAAKAPAADLPTIIDAINNLHKLIASPRDTALEQRVAALEAAESNRFNPDPRLGPARFR